MERKVIRNDLDHDTLYPCITCLTHTAQSQKWRESVSFSICHEVTLT